MLSFELSALSMLNCSMLIFVIGFAACQSMNVELFSTNASDCKLYYHEQELIVVITSVPFSKASQSFS